MTWLTTFYLRAFVVLLQIALVNSDENGPFPGFKQQPVDTIIQSSTNQSILCQVKGQHPLKVFWWKNEVELDTKNTNYLSISNEGSLHLLNTQRDRDEGFYRCIVENKYGRIISRRAYASFPYMKEFTTESNHVTVNEGEQVSLSCHAPGSYPDRNIHWSKMSRRSPAPIQLDRDSHVTISESGDLYFSYTTESDKGLYRCSVENDVLKKFKKRSVSLRWEKKDTISNISPAVWVFEDKIAMKDSNFMLECIAYGRPVPKMQFINHRTNKILRGAVQMGNRLRYEFGRFNAHETEQYTCEVKNTFGQTAKKTAYIRMEAKPEMLTKSREVSVSIDSKVHLPCVAYGTPSVTYKWFFNGQLETGNSEIEILNGNITIHNVMKHHEGFYQCMAKNKHGEALMTIHLKVVEMPPNFGPQSIPPAERTHATIGGKTDIFCVPSGAPKPSIRWIKKTDKNYIIHNKDRFRILPSGTLRIVNIKKSDRGTYSCKASNKLGTKSEEGELLVMSGLDITQSLTDRDTLNTGQKIILTCIISSSDDAEVVFTWKKFNRVLKNNSRTRIYRVGPKKSKVVISNANNADTGLYKCSVRGTRSRHDMKRQYILVSDSQLDLTRPPGIKTTAEAYKEPTELIVKDGVPKPPHDVTATEQDDTNIKISWTLGRDNGSPIRKVHIQGMTSYDTSKWVILKTTNNTESSVHRHKELVTLSPWAEYKIRVIAQNSIGLSKPSEETPWLRTPPSIPEIYPRNIQGTGISPNKIKVTFERLLKIEQNGPGITYYIYYKGVGMSYEWIVETVPVDRNFIILTFQKTDSYYKLYEFKLQAKNDVGHGPMSHVHTAHTGERTPVVVPRNLNVEIKSSLYIEATWQEVSKSRQALRGQFLGYKFFYWKKGESRNEQFKQTLSTYINRSTSVELLPFTEYYFAVLVFNNAGDGPISNEFGPLPTPEGRPSKPSNLRLTKASAGEATLQWDPPANKNGNLLKYVLDYFSESDGRVLEQELDVNVHEMQVSGLSPNKEYIFRMKALTTAGDGEIAEISFNFSKVPSEKPESPVLVSRAQTNVVLRWNPVKDANIIGYKIFYWYPNGETIVRWEQKDADIATIHYLNPGRKYRFQIAVYNTYGRGPKSGITEVETMMGSTRKPVTTEVQPRPPAEVIPMGSGETPSKQTSSSSPMKMRLNHTLLVVILLIAVLVPR